ncbi:MAG TPA: DNA translocase FtsK, partial [Bacteroidales bacterium]|nr:DNA translocase FtsK [Bacteroidales bacterium]
LTITSSVEWFKRMMSSLLGKKNPVAAEAQADEVKVKEPKVKESKVQPESEQLEENFNVVHAVQKEDPKNVDDDVELTIEEHIQREEPVMRVKQPEPEEVAQQLVEELGAFDPTLDLRNYKYPPVELLEDHKSENSQVSNEELISNKNKIVETLGNYKIQIDKIKATIGPTVTLYEIVPAPGIRISRIKSLEDDIALSLSALGIRIIAPMPGKGTIGIEVPNLKPEIVSMRSLITSRKFQDSGAEIAIAIGKTISNETFVFDLTKMPHLLVAGATGQGKSVGLNAIITSILYKKHPSQLKFVLVDPKKVELTLYSKIERHFLAKLPDAEEAIITDTQKVINTLQSLTIEMENRYELLKNAQVRNIKEYNERFLARRLNPQLGHRFLPYIVVVIDEFADLIMTAGREIETPIARLAQLARAIGIHLIIATQRPTTNIITGVIKANFPARIAFRVSSMIDSRTILDSPGANQLIGRGDLLFAGGSDVTRLQCAFIDIPELERITDHIGNQQGYPTAHLLPEFSGEDGAGNESAEVDLRKRDEMFDEAARLVVMHQQGSTSLIQRKFSIGYNRAGRIMDQLEAAGIVGAFEGSKARQVLFVDEQSLEQFLSTLPKN